MKIQITLESAELTTTVLHALSLLASQKGETSVAMPVAPTAAPASDLRQGKRHAEGLVEAWKKGWEEKEEVDRSLILRRYEASPGWGDLLAYLRHEGQSTRNLVEAGATEEIAGNIIAVGTACYIWETT